MLLWHEVFVVIEGLVLYCSVDIHAESGFVERMGYGKQMLAIRTIKEYFNSVNQIFLSTTLGANCKFSISIHMEYDMQVYLIFRCTKMNRLHKLLNRH